MNVAQLIEALKGMPLDAPVAQLWDGGIRSFAQYVYLARTGVVVIADAGMEVCDTDDRPESAPTAEENPHWGTPDEWNWCSALR